MPPVEPMLAKRSTADPRAATTSTSPSGTASGASCSATVTRSSSAAATSGPSPATSPSWSTPSASELPRALRGRRRDRHAGLRRRARLRGPAAAHSTRPPAGSSKLAAETPASFVAFDLLALGDRDLTGRAVRRAPGGAGAGPGRRASPVHLTPATTDPATGRATGSPGSRAPDSTGGRQARSTAPTSRTSGSCSRSSTSAPPTAWSPASAGTRTATSDRLAAARPVRRRRPADHVGVVGALPMATRRALRDELAPLITTFDGHPWSWRPPRRRSLEAATLRPTRTPRSSIQPWNVGKDLSCKPLRPERVLEVRYDHMEGPRFRHTAQFVRWRPDRTPASCTYDQLEEPVSFDLAEIRRQARRDECPSPMGGWSMATQQDCTIEVAGREVTITNPDKVFFPQRPGTPSSTWSATTSRSPTARCAASGGRPMALKRFVNGAEGEPFFQKRAPEQRPDWIETVELSFPSGRTADEVVRARRGRTGLGRQPRLHRPEPAPGARRRPRPPRRAAGRPRPGARRRAGRRVRDVALVARDVLGGLRPDRLAEDVRLARHPHLRADRAALDVHRGAPRGGGAGARGRAARAGPRHAASGGRRSGTASSSTTTRTPRTAPSPRAYSVRPLPDARVSTPLTWDEVPGVRPGGVHDRHGAGAVRRASATRAAGIDEAVGSLEPLLELAARDEAAGLPDAPWPPHYDKQAGEAPRVQPSKRKPASLQPCDGGPPKAARPPKTCRRRHGAVRARPAAASPRSR